MSGSTSPTFLLGDYAVAAANLVHGGRAAYSYANNDSGAEITPFVDLASTSPYAFTDCSGWVNYALTSVAPIHEAVLAAARNDPKFNLGFVNAYDPDTAGGTRQVTLDESKHWQWARAFVLASAFKAADGAHGFSSVTDFSTLRSGDLIAYATGIYTDPSNPNAATDPRLAYTGDTGHTMVVSGPAVLAWQAVGPSPLSTAQVSFQRDGTETLSSSAVAVYAVPVVDSSILPHMQNLTGFTQPATDDRPLAPDGKSYRLPADLADLPDGLMKSELSGGGLGTGTMWFSVDGNQRVLQFRFGLQDAWHANTIDTAASLITAVRMDSTVTLDSMLAVTLMANRTDSIEGESYAFPEHLQGPGGLNVSGTGTLTLTGSNSFTGGIVLNGVSLLLQDAGSAGTGIITTAAGTANTITVGHGAVHVAAAGNDTISATQGGSTVTGGHSLVFLGPSGASTVSGGSGSATISGGAGGHYAGGSAGHNLLFSAQGQATLAGGGSGDILVGNSHDVLLAAAGNATLFGGNDAVLADNVGSTAVLGDGRSTAFGSADRDTVYGGNGNAVVVGGNGATTVVGGQGDLTIWAGNAMLTAFGGTGASHLVVGSAANDVAIGEGAFTVDVIAGHAGGQLRVGGFRLGTDHIALSGYRGGSITRSVADGSLTLTLPDDTKLTLIGVASLDANPF